MADKSDKAAERAARERFERSMEAIKEGVYKFSSKLRGQSGVILDELIDPKGDAIAHLADVEGDAGALALAMPLDLITFETWLFGQIGDADELDLDINAHKEHWFQLGSWIGETLRQRHGGHWLMPGEDPHAWRMGFSKILLETAPFLFAEALLKSGPGAAKQLLSEIERLRQLHVAQEDKDGGPIDRFVPQHYIRLHTVPLGQWMVMEMGLLDRLWARATTRDLVKQVRVQGKRLGPQNAPVVEQVAKALEQLDENKPAAQQVNDRGLYEAVAQIVALRRTSSPLAVDVLEKYVLPAMHMGVPNSFPPLDDDDLDNLRKGMELFAVFVDTVPFRFQAEDEGFLGVIPHDALRTPYGDRRNLEIGKGDWVIVDARKYREMLLHADPKRLLDKYDEFVKYVNSNPSAPRRKDNGRMLAETTAGGLAELKACVAAAAKEGHELLFRMLPPPA